MLSARKSRGIEISVLIKIDLAFIIAGDKNLSIVFTGLYRGTQASRTSTCITAMRFYCAIIRSICDYIKRFCAYVWSSGHVREYPYMHTHNYVANDNS